MTKRPPLRDGIPCTHPNGTEMRSGLELTWAFFFEALTWPWIYEPIELGGTPGYIPDFFLRFETRVSSPRRGDDQPLLVDIKPLHNRAEFAARARELFERRLDWNREFFIGSYEIWEFDGGAVIGQFWSPEILWSPDNLIHERLWINSNAIVFDCSACGQRSIMSDCHSWHCRRCGVNSSDNVAVSFAEIKALWVDAKNRAQWERGRE